MIVFNLAKMMATEDGYEAYSKDTLKWKLADGMEVYVEPEEDDTAGRLYILVRTEKEELLRHPVRMEWCDQRVSARMTPTHNDIEAVIYKGAEGVKHIWLYKNGEMLGGDKGRGRKVGRVLNRLMKGMGLFE